MPTPTNINDLSLVAGSNYPAGTDSPAALDDVQRAHASFIALLRDGKASLDTQLANLITNGNGAKVVVVDMPPYNGNLSAALDAATEGTVLVLGMRDYNIVGKYKIFPGFIGNEVKSLKLLGAGMPRLSADRKRFVSGSGTVIQGTLLNFADGFEAYNLGVDVGEYVTTTFDFLGSALEAFIPGTHKFQGTPANFDTYIKDVAFGNIKALTVNNLNHAILCEYINGLTHGYCEAIGGFHGYVCKSRNVKGGDIVAYGQSSDAYIIKSDENTWAQDVEFASISVGRRGWPTRTGAGYIQSTNGGNITSRVHIGHLSGVNCKELFVRVGDPEPITDVTIGSVHGDDVQGNGVVVTGDMRRILVGQQIINNCTASGVYVDSNLGESIHIGDGVVTNSGGSGYTFIGGNHTHGHIKAVNNGAYGVNRVSGALDVNRITGTGNPSGLFSSVNELLNNTNLLNGWTNNGGGNWPFQVVLNGRTVTVRGTVRAGTSGVFATLPTDARPVASLSFLTVAITAGGVRAFAHVDVFPNGEITVSNFAGAAPGLGGTNCVVALNFSFVL